MSVLSPPHIQPSPSSLPFSSSGRDSARLRIERFEARLLGARAFPSPHLHVGAGRGSLDSILPLPVQVSTHSLSLAPHSSFFSLGALTLSLSLSLFSLSLFSTTSLVEEFDSTRPSPCLFSFVFLFSFLAALVLEIFGMVPIHISKVFIRKRSVGWFCRHSWQSALQI